MFNIAKAQEHFTAISAAQIEYAKSSYAAGKEYLEKMAGAKSPASFVEITTEYAKSAQENFFAEANKIGELYKNFGKDAFTPSSAK